MGREMEKEIKKIKETTARTAMQPKAALIPVNFVRHLTHLFRRCLRTYVRPRHRHEGRAHFVFLDGHVVALTKSDLAVNPYPSRHSQAAIVEGDY